MPKNIDISVIIVNYRSHALLREALVSFARAHAHCPYTFEFIIVDSASGPKELAALDHTLSQLHLPVPLRYRALETNRGFAAANNSAATDAAGRYFLFLNPDTVCHQDILSALAPLLARADTGAVSPVLRLPDGRLQPAAFGALPTPFGIIAHKVFRLRGQLHIASRQSVDWVSGACLAVSAAHFSQVHGFDSHFFMYFEDVDLCARLLAAGYRNYVLSNISIVHLGGARPRLTRARRAAYFAAQDRFLHKCGYKLGLFRLVRAPYRLICYLKDAP